MKFSVSPDKKLYEDGNLDWSDLDFLKPYGFELSGYSMYSLPPQKELFLDRPLPPSTLNSLFDMIRERGFNVR